MASRKMASIKIKIQQYVKHYEKAPTLIVSLFVIDAVLVLLYLCNWLFGGPFDKVTAMLDLDGEGNLPTWYSSLQLFLAAWLFGSFAFTQRSDKYKNNSLFLILLPLTFMLLSLDEVAEIHEWFGRRSDALFLGGTRNVSLVPSTGIWMLLLGPLLFWLMIGFVITLKSYMFERRIVAVTFCGGLLVFLISACGIEFLVNFVSEGSVEHRIEIMVEEFGEMVGGTLWIWSGFELLRSRGIAIAGSVTND